ncbi:MAG: hypothetical protein QM606_03245, partial [Leucobacter sp.]
MPRTHKNHRSRIEVDTALPVEEALRIARESLAVQRSLRFAEEREGGFVAVLRNWVGHRVLSFSVDAREADGRTRMASRLLDYAVEQRGLALVPASARAIEGYGIYLDYLRAVS